MLTKVISGGQLGSDIAGVRAAKRAGLATGGAMPKGFRTSKGARPNYAVEFGMVALDTEDYPARTRKNVEDSDVTIIIGFDVESSGSKTTLRAVRAFRKKSKLVELPQDFWYRESTHPHRNRQPESAYAVGEAIITELVTWLTEQDPSVVNIAGNRDDRLEPLVEAVLFDVFTRMKATQEKKNGGVETTLPGYT